MARKNKAVVVAGGKLDQAGALAKLTLIRSGYGASAELARIIASGEYDPEGVYKAFEQDAKDHGEEIGKSRTLAAVRMAWTRLDNGKGLSTKDGRISVVAKDEAKSAGASNKGQGRAPRTPAGKSELVNTPAPAAFTADGTPDGRAEQFRKIQADLAALISGSGLEEAQRMAAATVMTLQRLGFRVTLGNVDEAKKAA